VSGVRRVIDGVEVVAVEPGAPPPRGVPDWAVRCELVETPDLSPRLRPWVIGAGAAGALGSVVALAFFSYGGIVTLLPALVLLYHGLVPGTDTLVMPSERGRYLGFEVETNERREKAMAVRIAALAVGAVMAGGSIIQLFSAERREWLGLGTLAVIGRYFLYVGLTGDDGRNDAGVRPSSLRFRALADPSRPLAEMLEPTGKPGQETPEWTDSPRPAGSETNRSGSPPGR
jgi:hypothetical protein